MILESDLCKIFILGWLFLKYEYVVFLPYLWVFLGNFGATTTMPLPTTKAKSRDEMWNQLSESKSLKF